VDGSGSMNCMPGMATCKRTAQEEALREVFLQFKEDADSSVGVGMLYFGKSGSYPMTDDVPVAFVNDAQLQKLLDRLNSFPDGSTPTFEAMKGAFDLLDNADSQLRAASKAIVLMSDGEPNGNLEELVMLVDKFSGAKSHPIPTYSVGIGDPSDQSGYSAEYMSRIAVAGRTARPGCDKKVQTDNYCHFQLTPGTSTAELARNLQTALSRIKEERSNPCEFGTRQANGNPEKPASVEVSLIGPGLDVKLAKGDADGWDFLPDTDKSVGRLSGNACSRATADRATTIRIRFVCPEP
jgi:hypothetical protein